MNGTSVAVWSSKKGERSIGVPPFSKVRRLPGSNVNCCSSVFVLPVALITYGEAAVPVPVMVMLVPSVKIVSSPSAAGIVFSMRYGSTLVPTPLTEMPVPPFMMVSDPSAGGPPALAFIIYGFAFVPVPVTFTFAPPVTCVIGKGTVLPPVIERLLLFTLKV